MSAAVPPPTVSVIICCYSDDRWHDVVEAIKSLAEQTVAADEVLLVVDHNAALLERARAAFDGVRVVPNTHRRGLSGARNTGVELASGEIAVFLDDDAKADPDWLELLLAPYADAEVAAVGGNALPVWPDGRPPALLPPELYWVVGCAYRGQPEELAEVRNLMGCAMSFRLAIVRELGGFAEQIGRTASVPLGCEETELCIRLRQRMPDAKILLQPAATVRHRVSADRVSWRYLRRRSWSEGLSKAAVSRMVGQRDTLSTEQSYVRSVVSRALLRALGTALRPGRHGDGLAAAGGLLLATGAAGAGYLTGRARQGRTDPVAESSFEPVTVCAAELGAPLELPGTGEALVLVRSGRYTLGTVHCGARDRARAAELVDDFARVRHLPEAPPRPAEPPTVSVVIATAGRPELVWRCVRSLLDTRYPALEVLVVDNHSDGPAAELSALARIDDHVRYLREPVPGASRARNLGAREATGELLAFTDDDAVVDAGWVAELAAELSVADRRPDCVTGLVLPMHLDTRAQQWFEAFGGFGKGFQRREFGPDVPVPDPLYPLSPGIFGSGNNMAWHRQSFLDIGGFDPRLGPGRRTKAGEDLDLFVRLITGGGRLTYTPHALAWHEHRRTEPELRDQLRGYGTGLAAMFLVHAMRPRGFADIVGRLPSGLRLLLHPDSDRNAGRAAGSAGYPRRLVAEELLGMARAPGAVLRETLLRETLLRETLIRERTR
jgi:GT2 family glycosyltransferase